MIYFSIDIETAGTNWDEHTILEFGAILEDTKKKLTFEEVPKFSCLLKHPKYIGTPYAIAMNKEIFEELKNEQSNCEIINFNELGFKFRKWLFEQNNLSSEKFIDNFNPITITVAGKNFGTFDMRFLENLNDFKNNVWFRRRVLDPAVLCFDNNFDKYLPDLKICKERVGIENSEIAHRTIQDAWDVIKILREKMY